MNSRRSGGAPAASPGRAAAAGVLALVLAVGPAGCGPSTTAPPSAPSRALGTTTTFDLPSNGGALVTLPQPSAELTVVDAFAPTCAPSAEKLPALLAEKQALTDAGAKLVLVAVLADGRAIRMRPPP